MDEGTMSVGIRFFEALYDLGGLFLFVGDHGAKAKKPSRKMQMTDSLGKI